MAAARCSNRPRINFNRKSESNMSGNELPASHFVDAPGGRIRYHEAGEGPAIILLHGGGPGAYGYSNYRRNMQALAGKGFRAIVPDMPGYGETEGRSFEHGLFAPGADATLDLINHLGL